MPWLLGFWARRQAPNQIIYLRRHQEIQKTRKTKTRLEHFVVGNMRIKSFEIVAFIFPVIVFRFRRFYVGSLSVHFLKEKQSKFQEKSYFIAISQVRVRARYRLYGRLRTPGFRRLFSNVSRKYQSHHQTREKQKIRYLAIHDFISLDFIHRYFKIQD